MTAHPPPLDLAVALAAVELDRVDEVLTAVHLVPDRYADAITAELDAADPADPVLRLVVDGTLALEVTPAEALAVAAALLRLLVHLDALPDPDPAPGYRHAAPGSSTEVYP